MSAMVRSAPVRHLGLAERAPTRPAGRRKPGTGPVAATAVVQGA